jgi:tetratricopeptide (TPR) repeat protein
VSFLLRLAFALSVLALGAAASAQTPPTEKEIANAISELGDARFAVREKASAFLRSAGRAAEPALRAALKSDDAEVVRRAQAILDHFKWGVFPDTPKPIADLVQRYQGGDEKTKQTAAKGLLALGKPGYEALGRIASAEEDIGLRQALFLTISTEVAARVPDLVLANKFTAAEELLEAAVLTESVLSFQNYAAFLSWRGRLDERIRHFKERAGGPAGARDAQMLAYLYRAKGDPASARMAAEKANDPELLESLLFEQGDWKTLADKLPAPDGTNDAWVYGLRAACYRMAGQADLFAKALADLRKARSRDPWMVAEGLFANDRPHDATDAVIKGGDQTRGFELLALQLKFREAFQLVEQARATGNDELFKLEVLQARTLYRLGDRAKAQALFTQLAGELKDESALPHYGFLIETEFRMGLRDQAFAHAAQFLAKAHNEDPLTVFSSVFPKHASQALAWWRHLRAKAPKEDPTQTMQRVRGLLDGSLSEPTYTAVLREADQGAQQLKPLEYAERLHLLAETCLAAKKDELARGYLEKWADTANSSEAALALANFLAGKSLWKEAAEQYARSWDKDHQQAVPLYLRGWVLTKLGQEEEGRKWMDLAEGLLLGDGEQRYKLAEILRERNVPEAARRQLEMVVHMGGLQSPEGPNALGRLSDDALARKDFLKAAEYLERMVFQCLRTHWGFVRTEGYVLGPLQVHLYRARGMLAANRPLEEIRREIQYCTDAWPADANLPLLLVPELERAGHKVEADGLFDRALDQIEKVSTQYPQSASDRNELAWLAARCRRQLDKALANALKAVELAPDEPGYLDTLAEVYFQRGDKDKAIATIKKSIALDPKRAYFRKQLERMEAGDPLADVPESN